MSTQGDKTAPNSDSTITKTLPAGPASFSRTPSRIQTDNLLSISHIGEMTQRGIKYPRFIFLNRDDIYTNLVDLYKLHFQAKWYILKHLLDSHPAPELVSPETYLARVYISHWFIDLYVSNKEACDRHDAARHSDYYEKEIGRHSTVYDNYLSLILNSLKPTHIIGLQEDSLYIPVISTNYYWQNRSRNYFNIRNFTYNIDLFGALLRLIREPSSGWLTSTVSNDALGRPFWLLDWHKEKAYAWFPEEENYNRDDLNLAFILGVSCTPLLASRDDDTPQQFPNNTLPSQDTNFRPARRIDKRFHSMKDVRVYEFSYIDYPQIETVVTLNTDTGPSNTVPTVNLTGHEEGESVEGIGDQQLVLTQGQTAHTTPAPVYNTSTRTYNVRLNLFKIIDYKYYAKVIRKIDVNTRAAAHKILIFKD